MDDLPFLEEGAEKRLSYVELPPHLSDEFEGLLHTEVPLPVFLEESSSEEGQVAFSWDQVMLGLLHVLARQPQHQDIDYYRRLALAIQPQINYYLLQAGRQYSDKLAWSKAQQLLLIALSLHPKELWPQLELGFLYEQALRTSQHREDQESSCYWRNLANLVYSRLQERQQLTTQACYQMLFYYLNQRQYPLLCDLIRRNFPQLVATSENVPGLSSDEIELLLEQLQPFSSDRAVQRALEHYFRGEYQQAHDLLQQHRGASPFVRQLHAIQLYHLREYQRAKEQLEQLEGQLAFPRWAVHLALCCEALQLWDQAYKHWHRLLQAEPDHLQAMHHLALVSAQKGRSQEALFFWKGLACFDPSFPGLPQHLESDPQ